MNYGQRENSALAERILDSFPSGAYALSALLRVLDIVASDTVPTAAVECKLQPRMLINPAFLEKHAETSEKLLMLVMHELHHVLLGHTTLFPRVTRVQNFVFDAVINGLLCRMFPQPEHTAFFTDLYSADRFPECLLRPAPGWPLKPKPITHALPEVPEELREQVADLHRALYSETGASYQEVYDVLPRLLISVERLGKSLDDIPLVGNHESFPIVDGELEHQSPILFDIVRELVEQWPQPPDPIQGRSLNDLLKVANVAARREPSNREILRRLIRKVAAASGSGGLRKLCDAQMDAFTPIPSMARRSMVLRALGAETLLHPGPVTWRHRVSTGEKVRVYLDVSGSMNSMLKTLYGAVLDCGELVYRRVHLFSTKIADISLAELKAGKCSSTGGTDIGCVAEHMAHNNVKRALIVTDGWVGSPRGQHLKTLAQSRLAVAYLGNNFNDGDLTSVARHTAVLKTGA